MFLGLGWWITGLAGVLQRLKQTPRGTAELWLGTLAAMIAALAHGTIDLSYAVPDLILVWVLLTMLPGLIPTDTSDQTAAQEANQKGQP
jgi:hypothetical protein